MNSPSVAATENEQFFLFEKVQFLLSILLEKKNDYYTENCCFYRAIWAKVNMNKTKTLHQKIELTAHSAEKEKHK